MIQALAYLAMENEILFWLCMTGIYAVFGSVVVLAAMRDKLFDGDDK